MSNYCIIVDPATEDCLDVIKYMEDKNVEPMYVILTHEHTDHTWGCNTLIDKYSVKVICSQICKYALPKEGKTYFQFYYDNSDYEYVVKQVDIIIEDIGHKLSWEGDIIHFIDTPGHSEGSICFSVGNRLFTGDTIMQYKPFISKRNGSYAKYQESVNKVMGIYDLESTLVYPGHGEPFLLKDFSLK